MDSRKESNPESVSNMTPVNYDLLSSKERKLVRERYVVEQHGKCCYCEGSLISEPPEQVQKIPVNMNLFPRGFMKNPIHLHHSHETGMTIGAVHARCNAILWQYHGS